MTPHTTGRGSERDPMLMPPEAEPLTHRTDLVDLASFDEPHVVDLCCQHLNEHGMKTHF